MKILRWAGPCIIQTYAHPIWSQFRERKFKTKSSFPFSLRAPVEFPYWTFSAMRVHFANWWDDVVHTVKEKGSCGISTAVEGATAHTRSKGSSSRTGTKKYYPILIKLSKKLLK